MNQLATIKSSSIEQAAQSEQILNAVFMPMFQAANFAAKKIAYQRFKEFIEANNLSREEATHLIHVATGGNGQVWVPFIEEFERSPGGFPVFPALELSSDAAEYKLSTSIVEDVAVAPTPIIICGQSGSGKSTLSRAIMAKTIQRHPDVEFQIVDLQANRYMGLQRTPERKVLPILAKDETTKKYPVIAHQPNTVTFVTDGEDDHMLLATEAIKKAWNVYRKRNAAKQAAVISGSEPPVFHLYRLFLNEWNTFIDWAGSYKSADTQEFIENAKSRGISDPLTPHKALNRVRTMFRSGRDNMISCCVLTQDFTKPATGLSPQDQSNATLIAVGRVNNRTKTGGYDSVSAVFSDQYRIRDEDTRSTLRKVSQGLIRQGKPFLVSTQMYGSVGLFEDYSDYEKMSLAKFYKHEII